MAFQNYLLKVGNYQDVQNVINGHVTRNVGIKVLDGTEDWEYSAAWSKTNTNVYYCFVPDGAKWSIPPITQKLTYYTHFQSLSRNELYMKVITT